MSLGGSYLHVKIIMSGGAWEGACMLLLLQVRLKLVYFIPQTYAWMDVYREGS